MRVTPACTQATSRDRYRFRSRGPSAVSGSRALSSACARRSARLNVPDGRFEPQLFRLPDGAELLAPTLDIRGKGGLARVLPVPAAWELSRWIGEPCDRRDALQGEAAPLFRNPSAHFVRNATQRWSKASARRVWVAASRTTGLVRPDGRPLFQENEAMRRAFATHQAAIGRHLLKLSEFIGHRDPRTTRRYRQLSAGSLSEIVKP